MFVIITSHNLQPLYPPNFKFTVMNQLVNSVQFIGNLGGDPEVKTFENGNKLVTSMATYEGIPRGAEFMGADVTYVPLAADMTFDLDAIEAAVTEDTTAVYVCNPNNPTGSMVDAAKLTERQLRSAVHSTKPKYQGITKPIHRVSSLEKKNIDTTWKSIMELFETMTKEGIVSSLRKDQQLVWFEDLIKEKWMDKLYSSEKYKIEKSNLIGNRNATCKYNGCFR